MRTTWQSPALRLGPSAASQVCEEHHVLAGQPPELKARNAGGQQTSTAFGQIVAAHFLLLERRLAEVEALTSEEAGTPSSQTHLAQVVLQGV